MSADTLRGSDSPTENKPDSNDAGAASVVQQASPAADVDVAKEFLAAMFKPDDLIEFQFVKTWMLDGRKKAGRTDRRFHTRDEAIGQLREWALRNGEPRFENVFLGMCPRPTIDRDSIDDIRTVRALWCDLAAGLGLDEVREQMGIRRFPDPTCVVDSGDSMQLYWRLGEPFIVAGSGERGRVTKVLRTLAAELGGSRPKLTQTTRLPGFLNVHDGCNGSSPLVCRVVASGETVKDFFQFEEILDETPGRIRYPDPATEPPDTVSDTQLSPEVVQRVQETLRRGTSGDPTDLDIEVVHELAYAGAGHNQCLDIVRGLGGFTDPDDEHFELIWQCVQARMGSDLGTRKRSKFQRTDLGNAERLVAIFGDHCRYCRLWRKWLVWSGRRWQEDDTGQVARCARMTARSIYRDVKASIEQREKMELAKFAVRSESASSLKAMVTLAEADAKVAIRPAALDTDGWLLNCKNGTLDLRTGQLREHCRDDMITKLVPVEFDPEAKCARWLQFLDEVLLGDADVIRFVKQYLGMALTADVSEQILVIFNGPGSNGKSVLIDTMLGVFGDYATTAAPELLTASGQDRHPTEIADLAGRRLVVSSETDEGRRMRVNFIKQATGDSKLKARRMREDFWTFDRQFKLLLATNNLPRVREDTHAIWRRIKVVPFDFVVPDDQADLKLVKKLEDEWPGILRWAVEGCLDWQKKGLCIPDAVSKASLAYRQQEDCIAQFVEDCCHVGSTAVLAVTRGVLRKAYQIWSRNMDERATLTRNAFYKRTRELPGVQEARTTNVRGFTGIALARPGDYLRSEDVQVERESAEQLTRSTAQSQPSAATAWATKGGASATGGSSSAAAESPDNGQPP